MSDGTKMVKENGLGEQKLPQLVDLESAKREFTLVYLKVKEEWLDRKKAASLRQEYRERMEQAEKVAYKPRERENVDWETRVHKLVPVPREFSPARARAKAAGVRVKKPQGVALRLPSSPAGARELDREELERQLPKAIKWALPDKSDWQPEDIRVGVPRGVSLTRPKRVKGKVEDLAKKIPALVPYALESERPALAAVKKERGELTLPAIKGVKTTVPGALKPRGKQVGGQGLLCQNGVKPMTLMIPVVKGKVERVRLRKPWGVALPDVPPVPERSGAEGLVRNVGTLVPKVKKSVLPGAICVSEYKKGGKVPTVVSVTVPKGVRGRADVVPSVERFLPDVVEYTPPAIPQQLRGTVNVIEKGPHPPVLPRIPGRIQTPNKIEPVPPVPGRNMGLLEARKALDALGVEQPL